MYNKDSKAVETVIVASWYKDGNIKSHIETAKQLGLSGVMPTTWTSISEYTEETSTLLHKISIEGNDYKSASRKHEQTET